MQTLTHVFALDRVRTPTGPILVACDRDERLRALYWEDCQARMHRQLASQYRGASVNWTRSRCPRAIREALTDYVEGKLDALDAIPTATGGTAFQRSVWAALRTIPPGTTLTYAALAQRIGRPSAWSQNGTSSL